LLATSSVRRSRPIPFRLFCSSFNHSSNWWLGGAFKRRVNSLSVLPTAHCSSLTRCTLYVSAPPPPPHHARQKRSAFLPALH
jgi:hypothetical protein